MTTFQEKCLERLKTDVLAHQYVFDFIEKQGRTEIFVHGKVNDTEFWIYENMADLKIHARRRIFEPPDYESPQALIDAFVNAVLNEARDHQK